MVEVLVSNDLWALSRHKWRKNVETLFDKNQKRLEFLRGEVQRTPNLPNTKSNSMPTDQYSLLRLLGSNAVHSSMGAYKSQFFYG